MTTTSKLRLGLLVLFVALYLLPLGLRPLMEPDETRYAEIPREMLASGNWAAPHLNGLRYFEKPPLGYWANAVSLRLFGENAFAVRLPTALSVGLSAVVILLLCRRACQKEEVWSSPLAAFIFLTSGAVVVLGTFSVLDAMLSAALTLSMACFFLACQGEGASPTRRPWLLAAGLSCGAAFLLKGFLALVVPAISVGAYLLWERRWRDIPGLAGPALVSSFLTVLPWALTVHVQEPDFWHYFFWVEHVNRFLGGGAAQHAEPVWFYLLYAPLMLLPWSLLLPAAALGLKDDTPAPGEGRLIRFCLCWAGLPFVFFSLSSGKLATYILPCFPPLAILLGLGLAAFFRAGRRRAFQVGAGLLAGLFLTLALALVVVQTVGLPGVAVPYDRAWQWGAGLLCLLLFGVLPLLARRAEPPGAKLILFGLSPVPLFLLLPLLLPGQTVERKSPSLFLDRHRQAIGPDTVVLSADDPLRAVCWSFKRQDVLVVGDGGEVSYGLGYPEAQGRRLDLDQARAVLLANPGKAVLVARTRTYQEWRGKLPPPTRVDASGRRGYTLATY